MNDSNIQEGLPTPLIDAVRNQSFGAFGLDSAIIDLLSEIGFFGLFARIGWSKRSGQELGQLIFLLILRPLLHAPSIRLFCEDHFRDVFKTGKDALYRLLQRPFPWRDAHWRLVAKVMPAWRKLDLGPGYLVADATLRQKRGQRIEGICWHHDHVTGRKMMGLQIAALVWVNQKGVLGLDAALRFSRSPLIGNLLEVLKFRHDGRSAMGRRVRESAFQNKLEQTLAMAKRAVRAGITRTVGVFKETKQHLGLLEESVQSFEAVLACLHLTLMR